MLIFNGVVHPVDAPVIPNGYVELENDKIKGVGPMEALPKGCEGPSLDVKGGHIVPGFVDAHCHLGLFGDALKFEGDDGNEATNPCTPHVRAIDGVNPLDRCFQEAREGGVTTVLTGPGSANPISGQGIVIKTLGAWVDQMVLKAPATMKMALGENPKTVYNGRKETPTTRMGTASVIRTELARALEYMDRQDKADTEPGTNAPGYDPRAAGRAARPYPRPPGGRYRHGGADLPGVRTAIRGGPRHRGLPRHRAAGRRGRRRYHRAHSHRPQQARAGGPHH